LKSRKENQFNFMTSDTNRVRQAGLEVQIAKALSDAETAKRRATMALTYAKEALKYSACTPRVGTMIRAIENELKSC
jgi:hypothetical protein